MLKRRCFLEKLKITFYSPKTNIELFAELLFIVDVRNLRGYLEE